MPLPEYKNKWQKYRKTHDYREICDICKKSYIKYNKHKHTASKIHQVIALCKKVMMDHNNYLKNNNNNNINMLININGK